MKAFFLVGATATGKSTVAHHIALRHGWAVLSADSMLIYQGMDIGTAKPTSSDRLAVKYGGIDLVAPDCDFSAWEYRQHALKFLKECDQAGMPVMVVGGSGLYVKALIQGLSDSRRGAEGARSAWESVLEAEGVEGLRKALATRDGPALASLADPMNPRRLIRALEQTESGNTAREWRSPGELPAMPALHRDVGSLEMRIRARVVRMLQDGLQAEVAALLDHYRTLSHTAGQAIGYLEIAAVLDGTMPLDQAQERIVVRTRRLAKKQRTWFRHQAAVEWIAVSESMPTVDVADRVMEHWREHGPIEITEG